MSNRGNAKTLRPASKERGRAAAGTAEKKMRTQSKGRALNANEKTLAQHFTPPAVARLAWDAVRTLAGKELGAGARVVDPAAGEGALLAAVGPAYQTTGIELDGRLAEQGRGRADRFYTGDGLLGTFPEVADGSFDCALVNPPFGKLGPLLPWLGPDGAGRLVQRFGLLDGPKQVPAFPVEALFVERALQLTRPAGWLALILPEGFLANARRQGMRDWLLARAEVQAVVALPGAFNQVQTALVVLRGRKPLARTQARLLAPTGKRPSVEQYAQRVRLLLGASAHRGPEAVLLRVGQRALCARRWDPRFWQGRAVVRRLAGRLRLVPLGEYICHLTYGPIVTGRRPQHVAAGVPVIRQGDIAETGLDERALLCVAPAGAYDPPRSRVRPGDLLLSRSGAGALGRNRLAVYVGSGPANVGCFVDLIRLEGLNPFYAWFFFKTRLGRAQIAAQANGVGTPNINFGEIRALQIAALPSAYQDALETRYREQVWPLHCGRAHAAMRAEAERSFRAIVGELEAYLQTHGGNADSTADGG